MVDKAKLISAMKCWIGDPKVDCTKCAYYDPHGNCVREIIKDALELLKEQEAEKKKYFWECPECGSQLILKTSKISKAIGLDFGECPVCGKARYGKG